MLPVISICSECGTDDLVIYDWADRIGTYGYVECRLCDYSTPEMPNKDRFEALNDAAILWNLLQIVRRFCG